MSTMESSYNSLSVDSDDITDVSFDSDSMMPESGLKAYDVEPKGSPISSSDSDAHDNSSDDEIPDLNIWCSCGNCREMSTKEECVCCKKAVPVDFLEGRSCVL